MELLFAFLLAQEPTLDGILDPMDRRAAAAADVRFEIQSHSVGSFAEFPGSGYRVRVAFAGGRGRMEWIPQTDGAAVGGWGGGTHEPVTFYYLQDSIEVRLARPLRGSRASSSGLPCLSLRCGPDRDPILFPTASSPRAFFDCPIYACALRPDLLRHEPGLRLAGIVTLRGRRAHILTSVRSLPDSVSVLSDYATARRIRKTFWIDAETFGIRRMEIQFSGGTGSGARGRMEPEEFVTLRGGLELPTRVRGSWEFADLFGDEAYGFVHRVQDLAEGTGQRDVVPAWVTEDAAVESRGKADDDDLLGWIESERAKHPKSATLAANHVILRMRARGFRTELAWTSPPPHLAIAMAWASNEAGKPEEALRAIGDLPGLSAEIERVVALLALRRPKEAAARIAASNLDAHDRREFFEMLEDLDLTSLAPHLDESNDLARAVRLRLRMRAKEWKEALEGLTRPGLALLLADDLLHGREDPRALEHLDVLRASVEALEKAGETEPHALRALAAWAEKAGAKDVDALHRRLIASCARMDGDFRLKRRRMQIAADLAVDLAKASREDLAVEAGRAFLAHARERRSIPYILIVDQEKNPIRTLVQKYAADKKYRELFLEIKGIEVPWIVGQYMSDQFLPGASLSDLATAGIEELLRAKPAEADVLWFAKLLGTLQRASSAGELLRKAKEHFPKHPGILFALVEAEGAAGKYREAVAACDEILALEVRAEEAPRDRVLQRKSAYLAALGDTDKARPVLDAIDLARGLLEPWELWEISLAYERLQAPDRASQALLRAVELDAKPYHKLAQIYEKMEQYEGAVRFYRRAIREGYVATISKPRSDGGFGVSEPPSREVPEEALRALREKLGEDYFLDRFLARTFDPLTDAETRLAKAALERLQGDDIEDRDAAVDTLRRIGPRVTPLLRVPVRSGEEEAKARLRQLLESWAIPD